MARRNSELADHLYEKQHVMSEFTCELERMART